MTIYHHPADKLNPEAWVLVLSEKQAEDNPPPAHWKFVDKRFSSVKFLSEDKAGVETYAREYGLTIVEAT